MWAGRGERNKQSHCIQGDIDRFYFSLSHMTEAACWACGIRVRLFQDVLPSAICTKRAEIGLAIVPYHLLCGHMGWGYRMECMLVGEKMHSSWSLCILKLKTGFTFFPTYTANQKFSNTYRFLCLITVY